MKRASTIWKWLLSLFSLFFLFWWLNILTMKIICGLVQAARWRPAGSRTASRGPWRGLLASVAGMGRTWPKWQGWPWSSTHQTLCLYIHCTVCDLAERKCDRMYWKYSHNSWISPFSLPLFVFSTCRWEWVNRDWTMEAMVLFQPGHHVLFQLHAVVLLTQ